MEHDEKRWKYCDRPVDDYDSDDFMSDEYSDWIQYRDQDDEDEEDLYDDEYDNWIDDSL